MTFRNIAEHRADSAMRCDADGEKWPCKIYLAERHRIETSPYAKPKRGRPRKKKDGN